MRSIGMDVHAKQTYFCVLDEEGRRVERGKVETKEGALRGMMDRHRVDHQVHGKIQNWLVFDTLCVFLGH